MKTSPPRRLPIIGSLGPRSRTAIVIFAGSLASAGVAFVGSVLAARLLGAGGKGQLTAWTLVAACGTLLLGLAVPTGLGRAFLDGDRRILVPTALAHTALTVGFAAVVAGVGAVAGLDLLPLLCFVVLAAPASVLALDLQTVMQAAKRGAAYSTAALAAPLVSTAGMGVMLLSRPEHPLRIAYLLWAAGAIAASLTAAAFALRAYGWSRQTMLRESLRLGRGSYTVRLVDWLVLRVDQFFVVAFLSSASLGRYSVAVNCAEVCLYAGTAIALSVFEAEGTLDQASAGRIIRRAAWLLSLIGAAVGAAGFVGIGPVFGQAFESGRWALLLLIPGVVARGLALGASQMLLARGRGPRLGQLMLAVLVLALLLMLILIPLFGIEGAALASSLAYFVQMFLVIRELGLSATRAEAIP